MLRTYLEFSTSMPVEWNEAGDKCGANIVRAFAELLAQQGLVIEPIENAGDHGWDFVAVDGTSRLYFQVSPIDDILVIASGPSNWAFWLRKRLANFAAILTSLNEQLASDDRFSNVRWYSAEEYRSSSIGAATPLGMVGEIDKGEAATPSLPSAVRLQLAWWLSIWLALGATAIALTNLVNSMRRLSTDGPPWVLVPLGYILAFTAWRYAIGLQRKRKGLGTSRRQNKPAQPSR